MGLTTSCEAIERQASAGPYDSDSLDTKAKRGKPEPSPTLNVTPEPCEHGGNDTESRVTQAKKKRDQHAVGETPKMRKRQKSSGKPPGKGTPAKKKATPKKKTPVKKAATPAPAPASDTDLPTSPPPTPTSAPVNAHRAKILVAKQALAAIKPGTRIFIKSGEGNGGDTWWDSGVIQKIHERGKPFEVAWKDINNRGEEVDTDVERRIGLPVTYSLAGVAAEAIVAVPPGSEAAALARKGVLAKARIGSWCISHPEEPWGMLDPFGEDSSTVRDGGS